MCGEDSVQGLGTLFTTKLVCQAVERSSVSGHREASQSE